jgi:hypothetical protein
MVDEGDEPRILGRRFAIVLVTALLLVGGWLFGSPIISLCLGSFVDLGRYLTMGLWPTHRGYVETWSVKYEGDGVYTSWVEYLYDVDGEVYRGRRVRPADIRYRSEEAAKEGLKAFPVGAEVQVSVSPIDNADAVLDPGGKDWGGLALRLLAGCLILTAAASALVALNVPRYAVVLALCGLLGLGALWRASSQAPTARREGLSSAQMRERQSRVAQLRQAWTKIQPGDLAKTLKTLGEPDRVVTSPEGLQTWHYDHAAGMETSGKLQLSPSTRGLVVDKAFPPYATRP